MAETIKYDPAKSYSWQPDDVIEITGNDLGLLLNTIRAILSTETAAHIMLAMKCNDSIESIMTKGVESGIIKEQPKES